MAKETDVYCDICGKVLTGLPHIEAKVLVLHKNTRDEEYTPTANYAQPRIVHVCREDMLAHKLRIAFDPKGAA